jgi:chloramphenicol 3-O phosphotransferase
MQEKIQHILRLLCGGSIIFAMGACINKPTTTNSFGTVIIVNGPSAVGKSSIIRTFQAKQDRLWICAGIDNLYASVMPPKFFLEDTPEHHAVMKVTTSQTTEGPIITVAFGPEGQKVIKGMNRAIAAYAHAGNNVIVDYIQSDPAWVADLKAALCDVKVIWVGVTASLASIQQREKNRNDSPQGVALSHYHTVHQGITYDLMLDTDKLTPDRSADEIIEYLRKNKI